MYARAYIFVLQARGSAKPNGIFIFQSLTAECGHIVFSVVFDGQSSAILSHFCLY